MGKKTINRSNEAPGSCVDLMPFSGGGGGGALPAHEHTNIPLDGGPLDFVNTTISSMNLGSTTYSNGAALQELLIGNPAEALVVNGAGTAPEWSAALGAGSMKLLDDQSSSGTGNTFEIQFNPVVTFANYSMIKVIISIEDTGGTGNTNSLLVTVNNEVSGVYRSNGTQVTGGAQSIVNRSGETSARIVDTWGDVGSALVEIDFMLPVYASGDEISFWSQFASELMTGSASHFVNSLGQAGLEYIDIEISNTGGTPTREIRVQTYGIES